MIELSYTRERMLADIGATPCAELLDGLSEPAAVRAFVEHDQALLQARFHEPSEILSPLQAALTARFAAVPPELLRRNLLGPIKCALGNAFKRGNLMDPSKWITLVVVVTPKGAFIEISDAGSGFDVATTYERFRAGSIYFVHRGLGFRRFQKARMITSFADGGRTFRACFVREGDPVGREAMEASAVG